MVCGVYTTRSLVPVERAHDAATSGDRALGEGTMQAACRQSWWFVVQCMNVKKFRVLCRQRADPRRTDTRVELQCVHGHREEARVRAQVERLWDQVRRGDFLLRWDQWRSCSRPRNGD